MTIIHPKDIKDITVEYLLSKTHKTSTGCMEWRGRKGHRGYGQLIIAGKLYGVTRLVLSLLGHDLKDKLACHSCDNPPCINPNHLFAGTQKENMQDAIAKGRIKKSPHGAVSRYVNAKCRCEKCRAAWADYFRDRHRLYRSRSK